MKEFIRKHAEKITAVLSCFDRLIFKGYLPFSCPQSLENFFDAQGLLLKEFKTFCPQLAQRIKAHGQAAGERAGRPFRYLSERTRKEDLVRRIAEEDQITKGLICVLSVIEPCRSFKLAYGQGRPRLIAANRKCLFLCFYFLDRDFGFMHVRIQTWFPFTIQVYINGHDWLARKMDKHGLKYQRMDNAFTWLEDADRAQRFADKLADRKWPRILNALARRVNPLWKDLLAGMDYYWVTDQAEYSTDVLFKDLASLKSLYQDLLWHATLCFSAEDVLTFLGRKLHGQFAGEVLNDCKKRQPGARVKHRMKENWIKMYDKHGVVLRIETVINHPREFKIRRWGKRHGQLQMGWYPMAKGVANLGRYAEVCRAANSRYLQALSVVDDPAEAYHLLEQVCEPAAYGNRKRRGLNPLRRDEAALFAAVLRGEHAIGGFRNGDLAKHLYPKVSDDPGEQRRRSSRITRLIQLLRAHRLIAKVPRARRYRLTLPGATLMAAAVALREQDFPAALSRAA